MTTRTAVVTGASSGIGLETAKALASDGWRIIGVGRDAARSAQGEAEIRTAAAAAGTPAPVTMLRGDLSLLSEAARIADEIAGLTDRIDVLVNNAGGMAKEQVVTAEGNERNFASNHLGPFVLTRRLLPLLRRAATDAPAGSVRILQTSSDASEMIPDMNWDDIQMLGGWNSGAAYCRGKLANVLFTKGLAERVAGDGIVVHAMHPGAVSSNFASHATAESQATMAKYASLSPVEGADTLIWLATDPAAGKSSGGYFHKRQPRDANPIVNDAEKVERLWTESERIAADAGV